MSITRVNLRALRTQDWCDFIGALKSLVEEFSPKVLQVESNYAQLVTYHAAVCNMVEHVDFGPLGDTIIHADSRRKTALRKVNERLEQQQQSANLRVRWSARRIHKLLVRYDEAAYMSYKDELAALAKVKQKLQSKADKYRPMVRRVGVADLLLDLRNSVEDFKVLMGAHHEEGAAQACESLLNMRRQGNTYYRALVKRLDKLSTSRRGRSELLNNFLERYEELVGKYVEKELWR